MNHRILRIGSLTRQPVTLELCEMFARSNRLSHLSTVSFLSSPVQRRLASSHASSIKPLFSTIQHLQSFRAPFRRPLLVTKRRKTPGLEVLSRSITSAPQDVDREKELQKKKLKGDPSEVSSTSSIRPIIENAPIPPEETGGQEQKEAVKGGLQHDLGIIKETFAFREVPKEVLMLGGAGLVPYVVTTMSTLFLAWDVKNIQEHGTGYLLNDQTAIAVLEFLEPVQVGFGAVILSFLGAIHWGLEFAAFGGSSPYRRYFLGILAPALAWPTVFMPYDIALLTQFLGFTGMYFADARATSLGWAPRWYTTYRFLLTFIVGACIVATLIGRGKIGDKANIAQTPDQRVRGTRQSHMKGVEPETSGKEYDRLVREEQEIIRKKAEEDKKRAEEELAQKEEEYKKAKDQADRMQAKLGGKE